MTSAAFALLLLTAGRDRPEVIPRDPAASRQLVRDALTLYGVGILRQRQDRLVEATRCLEDAVRLDPEAVPPRQLLIPLYTALGRPTDAASAAAAVVVMDPAQADTWRTLARLLDEMKRTGDAISVLNRCVAAPALADRPADRIAAFRDLARLNTALGTHPQAAAACRKAIALTGEHRAAFLAAGAESSELDREQAGLYEMLATASLAAGKFVDARDAALEAREGFRKSNDPNRSADLTSTLAAAYAGLGEPERSHKLLDPHLAARPRDVTAFALKARLLREADAGQAAIALLTRAADAEPEFAPLWVLLGDECRRLGERGLAEQAYRAALEKKADVAAYRGLFAILSGPGGNPTAMLGLIDAKAQTATPPKDLHAPEDESTRRRREAAAEHTGAILAALRQEPAAAGLVLTTAIGDAQGRFGRRSVLAQETWRLLAEAARRAGQLGTAESLLRAALADAPSFDRVTVYQTLIQVLWAARKYGDIVELCRQGLNEATGKNSPPRLKELLAGMINAFHYHSARALTHLGKIDEALREADAAACQGGGGLASLTFRICRIDVLMYAERYLDAEKDCLTLFRDYPQPGDVQRIRHMLAIIHSTARQFDKAEEQLRLILELDPADAEAHNSLGYELADRGRNLDEAERLIRRALELDRARKSDSLEDEGENANYLDSLGWVLFRRSRFAEAKELIERATGMPTAASVPEVWDHLGDVCARMDKPAAAAAAWERALDLSRTEKRTTNDPRGAEIERKLKRLHRD